MKLTIDTEKQEIEILDPASFLEVKLFLEGIDGGIGYTVVSGRPSPFPFVIGGAMEMPPEDEGPDQY
jgi:hypothetical protein